jgi:hypothetical protein
VCARFELQHGAGETALVLGAGGGGGATEGLSPHLHRDRAGAAPGSLRGGGLKSVHYEQLALDGLSHIGASTAHAQLDSIAQQAAAAHWSYSHFLGRLLEPEIAARRQRVMETSLHFSGLPWMKRLSDFDFAFQPKACSNVGSKIN